ncbi:MAG: hypothetical protein JRJ65_14810 [Deltaproteobacteria bacterium]|nr:hypothetical protein [Deltaproteobacteria bacterium]
MVHIMGAGHRSKLAGYKALEELVFVDSGFFPRNALGKIMKTSLRNDDLRWHRILNGDS